MNKQELGPLQTPSSLMSEVREFRAVVANPARTADEIKRAFGLIVDHAGHLNPRAPGFESAGLALKEAVCMWLDCQSHRGH